MTLRSVSATAIVVTASLCVPCPGAAFEICEVSSAGQDGAGTIHCEVAIDCTSSADCELERFPDATCEPLAADRDYCQPRCGSVFRCNPENLCPVLTGTSGTCSPGWDGNSYCRYPTAATITYCVEDGETIPEAQFYRCHHIPGTEEAATTHYQFGDCDGDGCPNMSDSAPCDPATGAVDCMALTPPPECRPSFVPADGGVGTADAGAAGDGGGERDGSAGRDGGSETTEPRFDYRGSGGCAVTDVSHGSGWSAWLAVLGLAVAVRRNRRRSITPAGRACAPRAPRGSWASRP